MIRAQASMAMRLVGVSANRDPAAAVPWSRVAGESSMAVDALRVVGESRGDPRHFEERPVRIPLRPLPDG